MARKSSPAKPSHPVGQPTRVDPEGIGHLNLATAEVPQFFKVFHNYCTQTHARAKRRYLTFLLGGIGVGLWTLIWIVAELGVDEDDPGGFAFFIGIVALVIWIIVFSVKLSGNAERFGILGSKASMLQAFFAQIQPDLHPESGVKGTLDHRDYKKAKVKPYRTKRSPHSGAQKTYVKYVWGTFKFTLLDGSSIRLRCIDKVKDKSGAVVRFLEIQKGMLYPNTQVYQVPGGASFLKLRKDVAPTLDDFKKHADHCGLLMAQTFKRAYRDLSVVATVSPAADLRPAAASPASAKDTLNRVKQCLLNTQLQNLVMTPQADTLQITWQAPGQERAQTVYARAADDAGLAYVQLFIPSDLTAEHYSVALQANATLAYGAFGLDTWQGQMRLMLFKSLLVATLDPDELDTAIQGLMQIGGRLEVLKALPDKAREYKFGRDADWEQRLLTHALAGISHTLEAQEGQFKVGLQTSSDRSQSVHVRFDRQDLDGHQMISLLSYAGGLDESMYEICLKDNAKAGYGAVAIAPLGGTPMFVVCENHLAQSADPEELRAALLRIADRGDDLEAVITGQDRY